MKAFIAVAFLLASIANAAPGHVEVKRVPSATTPTASATDVGSGPSATCAPDDNYETIVSWHNQIIAFGDAKPSDIVKKALTDACSEHTCDETPRKYPITYATNVEGGAEGEITATMSGSVAWDCEARNNGTFATDELNNFIEAIAKYADTTMTKNNTQTCTPGGYLQPSSCKTMTNNWGVSQLALNRINTKTNAIEGTMQITLDFTAKADQACSVLFGAISTLTGPLGPIGGVMSGFFGNFKADICPS